MTESLPKVPAGDSQVQRDAETETGDCVAVRVRLQCTDGR
ncbi:hypothetical protein FsymDg_1562 [Candidatus Protofrankia datiscae]|uniref:Uncharacterized protein n=1 Tax=Candidatus Protofrankia datiscae TaxID=2716812 RepID=F8B3S7_9ACTN|nr:hypothetical protein FsymDg_1562 [Candidatus Protofrankia datiscae]